MVAMLADSGTDPGFCKRGWPLLIGLETKRKILKWRPQNATIKDG